MATKTKKPTGLSITRSGNTYTLKWKIGAKNYGGGQNLKYSYTTSTNSGGANIYPSATATSYTLTLTGAKTISFSVRGKRKKEGNTTYSYSDWASTSWTAVLPATPSLTYKNEGTNKGMIEWSCSNDPSSNAVFTGLEYQTCIERNAAASGFRGAPVLTRGAAGSELVIESSADIAAGNFVRWFRIRSYGPAGYSPWVTAYHAYGAPRPAVVTLAQAALAGGAATRVTAAWLIAHDIQYPVDELSLQYVTGVPTDIGLSAPSSGWSDAMKLNASLLQDQVVVNVPDVVGADECMWVRVVADHDSLKSYSNWYIAQVGRLQAPTIDAVPNTSTGYVSITITEETGCDVAATAIFFRSEDNPSRDRIVAIFPHGTTSGTVSVPEIIGATHTCFGAYSFVGTYSGTTISNPRMKSDSVTDSDIPAVAPANVTAVEGPTEGTVRLSWVWSWIIATHAELSWSDDEYSWESTNEPQKYQIDETKPTSWIVAGLEIGRNYYFRVRLVDKSGTSDVVGPWSHAVTFDLFGIPEKPVLTLSKSVINSGDTVVGRWAFMSSGDDEQEYAEICLVTYDEDTGDPIYGDVIARTGPEQSVEITKEWEVDTTYYLALRTTSTSGSQSEWSDAVSLYVTTPITIELDSSTIYVSQYKMRMETTTDVYANGTKTSTTTFTNVIVRPTSMSTTGYEAYMRGDGIESVTMTEEDDVITVITEKWRSSEFSNDPEIMGMPVMANIIGAGTSGTTTLSIVRAAERHFDRPNGEVYDGYPGELIASKTQLGEDPIYITVDDLIGSLDDGASYYLIGKVTDEYGQSASFQYPFWVNWTHKAVVPSVTVEMDPYQRIAMITPVRTSGMLNTEVCDIYRLSADKPELIVKGATFGETYVDPYPAFGPAGGHRLVTITPDGDYTTSTGLAWYDAQIDDGDILHDENMVIDVDGEQIVLPYNLELSNKWGKDFKRTSYLGGSVQGDWNPAVTRDLSANTVLVRGDDLDRQLAMRDLAGYAGVAHIRTPDGSSLTVNVQIDERQSYDSKKVSYTLTMQAIDPEALDGMTLAEWKEMHPIGE